jgi:hypothetical protein
MVLDKFSVTVAANSSITLNNTNKFYLGLPNIAILSYGVFAPSGNYTISDGLQDVVRESEPLASSWDGDVMKLQPLNLISENGWFITLKNNTSSAVTFVIVIEYATPSELARMM